MEYDFELSFKLGQADADPTERVGDLEAAGCDDAAVGVGAPGQIALMFTREAKSAQQAIVSAIEDVKRALPEAQLIEVSPDLVGLSDIAELVSVSRQNMRKLMMSHAGAFPSPVHNGSTVLWHLAPMLEWLMERNGYEIDRRLFDVARVAMQVNLLKELQLLEEPVPSRIRALVAPTNGNVKAPRKPGAVRAIPIRRRTNGGIAPR